MNTWSDHVKQRKVILIEKIDTEEKFLLPLSMYIKIGIPKGFLKKSQVMPYPEHHWNEVKDLPIYNFCWHKK